MGLLGIASGCSADAPQRPPPSEGPGSGVPRIVGLGGQGSEEQPLSEETRSIAATFSVFVDDLFERRERYAEPAILHFIEPLSQVTTSLPFDGIAFVSDQVPQGPSFWVATEPTDALQLFPTLTLQDTSESASALDLWLADRLAIDAIFASLITPTAVRPESAQILFLIRDEQQQGIPGVIVSLFAAGAPLYFDAGVWTEFADRTDASGKAFSPNVAASALPGQDVQVVLSGSTSGEFVVRAAAGMLTIAQLEVEEGP